MHHILPSSTPINPIRLAKTHTHPVNHSRSYLPYQYFSSILFSYFPGLCTLHTACTHCSSCFLASFNQSQQVTLISFLHLMLHRASWLAGTAELLWALTLMVSVFLKQTNKQTTSPPTQKKTPKQNRENVGYKMCLCTIGHQHTGIPVQCSYF